MNSLLTRMVIFFSSLILLAGAALGYTIYRSSTALIGNSLGQQAQSVAERAAKLIDPEAFAKLTAESAETDYYHKLRAQLNELKEANGLKYLYTLGAADKGGKRIYYYVVDGAPDTAKAGEFSALGEQENNGYQGMIDAFADGKSRLGELTRDEYGATVTAYVPVKDQSGKLVGLVGADFDASKVYARMKANLAATIYISLGIMAVSILLVFLLARFLIAPLRRLTSQVGRVREGDLTVEISTGRKDEIGQLAATFQQLVVNTRAVILRLRDNTERLLHASEGVADHARRTSAASRSITESILEAASGANTQVQRTSEMTRAMEETTSGMQRIAESASIVAEVAQETMGDTSRGNELILTAMSQMDSIHASSSLMQAATKHLTNRSGEIGEIVTLMTEIASQTDLLALNAAIEAARAGEHGRGFAVVAGEVRKLANQSQASAMRIAELIQAILRETASLSGSMEANAVEVESGLGIVREAGDAFRSILAGLERVNEQLQEVSAASEEVSASSEEVAASVEETERISLQAAHSFQGVAETSEAQLAAMEEVTASAESLRAMSDELTTLIKRFKA